MWIRWLEESVHYRSHHELAMLVGKYQIYILNKKTLIDFIFSLHHILYMNSGYFSMLECLDSALKTTCTAKQTESVNEFIRNMFQSIIDVACGDFVENSDKCERLATPPKRSKKDKSSRTFFLPLVELWNNLE